MSIPRPAPHATGTIATDDGLTLFTQQWTPSDRPERARLAVVHGYAEHSRRYAHVAEALTDHGVGVYAYDQRGHGRSDGKTAYVDAFDQYLDDLQRFLRTLPDDSCPLFLFGHSMGGVVALLYALERPHALRGLILSSPAIEIDDEVAPLLRKMAHLVGRLAPTLPTIHTPRGVISRDPEVVAEAEADPLNYHGRVRARTGSAMIRAAERAQDQIAHLETPFLVFHGTADRLTAPEASRVLYQQAPAADKTLRLYEGYYHETFNDPKPDRDRVIEDLTQWITERID
jgi:alpha-beta hydrolase superfamily lysophospholipase